MKPAHRPAHEASAQASTQASAQAQRYKPINTITNNIVVLRIVRRYVIHVLLLNC